MPDDDQKPATPPPAKPAPAPPPIPNLPINDSIREGGGSPRKPIARPPAKITEVKKD